jgi:dCTP deaminase
MAQNKRERRRGSDLLNRRELIDLIRQRKILVEPLLDQNQIDNIGVDLRLDCFFREFVRTEQPYLTPAEETPGSILREIEPFRDSFFLQPGEFALGQSLEYIALPNDVLCFLNGRSSLGRRGLVVHATANVVDPGWRGHLVFELANLGAMAIQLVPLMRIARLVFLRTKLVKPYNGAYVGQIRNPPPPRDKLVHQLVELARKGTDRSSAKA